MKREKCTVMLFVFSFFLLASASYAKELNVPIVNQVGGNLCWAACSKAIFEYYGITERDPNGESEITLCEIAEFARSERDEGGSDCCFNLFDSYCDRTLPMCYNSKCSTQQVLENWGVSATCVMDDSFNPSTRALTPDEIVYEIDRGRPFVMNLNLGNYWHAVVGVGYDNGGNMVHYMDPLSPRIETADYDYLVQVNEWNKTVTTRKRSYTFTTTIPSYKPPKLIPRVR